MRRKAAEAAEEDEEISEKKYRKCEKAGCTATCPVCFASAAERFGFIYLLFIFICTVHFLPVQEIVSNLPYLCVIQLLFMTFVSRMNK